MGSDTVIAVVVGAVLVIVGFALWPVLNGAVSGLFSYFRASCDDGYGNRFLRVYEADDTSTRPADPGRNTYYPSFNLHGGEGERVTAGDSGECATPLSRSTTASYNTVGVRTYADRVFAVPVSTPLAEVFAGSGIEEYFGGETAARVDDRVIDVLQCPGSSTKELYNERGERIGAAGTGLSIEGRSRFVGPFNPLDQVGDFAQRGWDLDIICSGSEIDDDYRWVEVAPMLQRFAGINSLLLSILPVVSIAGFLGISGAKLYSYGKGMASIGNAVGTAIITLVGIVIALVVAGPVIGSMVESNQVVVSGQYQVNSTFGNIIQLLFAVVPVVYVGGLVTLVGLQARTALTGGRGGGQLL